MARFTIYLRQRRDGWEWSRTKEAVAWWGIYRTEGHAKSAAKRSVIGGRGNTSRPEDFEFIRVNDDG